MSAKTSYTEEEHLAILASRVEHETATHAAALEVKDAEIAKRDAAIATLEAEKEALGAELASIKDEAEKARLGEARLEQAREKAKHISPEFFTAERAAQYGKLTEDAFAAVLESFAAPSTETPPAGNGVEIASSGAALGGEEKPAFVPNPSVFAGGF